MSNIKPDKRTERNTPKPRGPMQALELSYNDQAGALNVTSRVIPPIRKFLGDIVASKPIEGSTLIQNKRRTGGYVLCVNTTGAFLFVGTSKTSPASVTGGADGIPIPPNDWVIISMGEDVHIISSGAGVFGYEIDADTYIS